MDKFLVEVKVEDEVQLRQERDDNESPVRSLVEGELGWLIESGLSSKMIEENLYIGVGTQGGLVTYVFVNTDIEAIKDSLKDAYHYEDDFDNEFDPEDDDARIFNNKGKEVFSMFSSMVDAVYTKPEEE